MAVDTSFDTIAKPGGWVITPYNSIPHYIQSEKYDGSTSLTQFAPNVTQELLVQTIFAQVYLRGNGGGNLGYIFGHCSSTATNGIRFFYNSPSTSFGFGMDSSGAALAPGRSNLAGSVSLSGFYTVAFTWDGGLISATAVRGFLGVGVNPLIVSENASPADGSGSINGPSGQNIIIGNRNGSARTFDGDIFQVARWNRVLSLGELHRAQYYGVQQVPENLVFHYVNKQDYGRYNLKPTTRTALANGTFSPLASPIGLPISNALI